MKMIVSDLDGTLLNSNHEICEQNINALKEVQKKGVRFVIATGRTYADAMEKCRQASISAYMISNNGASTYLSNGEKLDSTAISKELVCSCIRWLHDNGYHYEISTDKNTFILSDATQRIKNDFSNAVQTDDILEEELLDKAISLVYSQHGIIEVDKMESILDVKENDYCNILAHSFSKSKLSQGRSFMQQYANLSMVSSGKYNFELVHHQASKGNALERLAAHLGVPLSEIIAVGDSYNDISMLQKAGFSVAMGNAADEVKNICTYITKCNDDGGVAHMINSLMLRD